MSNSLSWGLTVLAWTAVVYLALGVGGAIVKAISDVRESEYRSRIIDKFLSNLNSKDNPVYRDHKGMDN